MHRGCCTMLGCVPSYYLRYFYAHDEVVGQQRGAATRGQRVAEIEAELLELYADPALEEKPDLLMQRGGALLLRGRGRPDRVARWERSRAARGERSQRRARCRF